MLDGVQRFYIRKKPILKCKRLSDYAVLPKRASVRAAGADLCSAYDYVIPPKERLACFTDLALELPRGCYGRIAPRGSISLFHHVDIAAGVIDRDFRGNVAIVLINLSDKQFEVKAGEPIAQLILERAFDVNVQEVVEEEEDLSTTERGEGGWGSTDLALLTEDLGERSPGSSNLSSIEQSEEDWRSSDVKV